jgi:hypothetical protein
MWIRRRHPLLARMPSTRAQPLNPRLVPRPPAAPKPAPGEASPAEAGEEWPATRPGGFHESSYELKSGLEVSESEWPEETTVPGRLGER